MSEKSVSSLIVVDGGRPVGVLSQGDLLGLAVGVGLGGKSAKPTSDVYVQIHGLRGSADPETLGEIDQVVAQGLRRISRHVKPLLLSLHITPHSNHRSGDASVVARLHTDRGIFYASETEWNYFAGIAALMDDLGEQVRRAKDDARQRRRVGPLASQVRVDETVGDDALEAQLRTMTPQRAPRRR
jgi:ribosome-associated translation inhibitor RaiA